MNIYFNRVCFQYRHRVKKKKKNQNRFQYRFQTWRRARLENKYSRWSKLTQKKKKLNKRIIFYVAVILIINSKWILDGSKCKFVTKRIAIFPRNRTQIIKNLWARRSIYFCTYLFYVRMDTVVCTYNFGRE